MHPKFITPLLLSMVVVWAIYRRLRRSVGRQSVDVGRLKLRIGALAVAAILVVAMSMRKMDVFGALIGGMVGGAALGYVGLRHTRFEVTAQGRFYTPHTYIGLLVFGLLLGRLAFRFVTIYAHPDALPPNQDPLAGYQRSALTLAIFGVLIGYLLLFNLGVLKKSRELALSPPDAPGS